jgi:NAD(P)-dependent dehydrogenase (short-subunit alcohol dehydrogenase family)
LLTLLIAAVKKSVNGLVEGGSVMLASSNIRVNGMAPGFTQTSILTSSKDAEKGGEYDVKATEDEIKATHKQFFERAGLLKGLEYYHNRTAAPEELARVGVFLASDLSSSINGVTILADSGKTAAATGEGCTGPVPAITPLSLEP